MSKFDLIRDEDGEHLHWCSGCKSVHVIPVDRGKWSFNGDLDNPTYSPSVKHDWTFGAKREPKCCHYFIQNGEIAYCGDCTHGLAGKTVPLVSIWAGSIAEEDGAWA